MHERYHYGAWDSDMSANPRPAYGAVYPHRSDNPDWENSPAYHRRRFYCLGGFRYIFRRTGGTWKRHSFITDFTLPVCGGHPTGCVLAQQAFRRRRRLACVLDHGSDRRAHFPYHLPQGDCKTCDDGPKGMNAYTISSGIFPKYLNGENIISVPLAENEIMHIGYVLNENQELSELGKSYLEELRKHAPANP